MIRCRFCLGVLLGMYTRPCTPIDLHASANP
ncbi:Uncharacterised protein [Mycobacteroides abscessus subsp. abscessus]|nr:Uncharacterised protein [Mycobacteroides abscessus subsp. abscessus]